MEGEFWATIMASIATKVRPDDSEVVRGLVHLLDHELLVAGVGATPDREAAERMRRRQPGLVDPLHAGPARPLA